MIKQYLILSLFLLLYCNIFAYYDFKVNNQPYQSTAIDTLDIRKNIDSALSLCATDYSKSLYLLDEALDLAQKANYDEAIGDIYYVRSRVYYYKDNYNIAIKYLNKAKSIYDKIGSSRGLAKYFFGLGSIETLYGNDIKAIKAFQKAMQYEEQNHNFKGKSRILNSLASVNLKMKNFKIALEYAKKALILKKKLGNKKEISNTLTNLGEIYQNMDSLDKAEEYFQKGLDLRQKLNDKRRIGSSLLGLAKIHILKKDLLKAENELIKALKIFTGLNEKTGQVLCLLELSKTYNTLNFNKKNKKAIEKAIYISKNIQNQELLKNSFKQYADFYSNNKNYKKAYKYFKKYVSIKDSLIFVNNKRIFNDLEMKYQSENKDNEIKLLKKKNEIQRKNSIILILSVVILLFITVLLFFFYRSKAQKLQIKSKLLKKEKIIHKQDLEIKEHETKLLKHELESKSRELTAKVLVMLKTNQMLDNILQKLSSLNKKIYSNKVTQKDISSIIREIENHSGDTLWQDFDKAFKGVYSEFYEKLLKINPQLTPAEIKMASLLKMNLNTKEIADITFKSESSIKSTRFRLRKKLGLDNDKKLVGFLIKL